MQLLKLLRKRDAVLFIVSVANLASRKYENAGFVDDFDKTRYALNVNITA